MKKIYLFLFAVIATGTTLMLSSCGLGCKHGSGHQITQVRQVGGFSKIDISGAYKVLIKQDSVTSVSIMADDNLMRYIKSDVDGDKLRIHSTSGLCSSGTMVLNISVRDLSSIKTSGAINVESQDTITVKNMDFDLSGATKINMILNADNVNTRGSGFTELDLSGQASTHNVELSGAGHLNALNFVVGKYSIETSGASSSKINVLNQLDINSSGASDVQYKGNPTVNNNKSGASSIKKID